MRWKTRVDKVFAPMHSFLTFMREKVFSPLRFFFAYTIWKKAEEFLKITFTKSNDDDNLIS